MAPASSFLVALLGCSAGTIAAQAWDSSLFTSSEPIYPSPKTNAIGWEAAAAKVEAFMSNMTLEEKAILVTGSNGPCVGNIAPIPRLGFKGLCLQDGPLALRWGAYVSSFPAGLTAAASWDRDLIYQRGEYLGAEFRAKGSHVYLGPVAGPLGRSGMGGRNWEGFSPDPYLTGVAMEETIIAVQAQGVQASAKHFIAYEQETQRNPAGTFDSSYTPLQNASNAMSVSSNVEDRTLHELYMWPFANSVRAGVANVMCSYNRVNGSWACQNPKLLNGLLKTELGFQGFVVSDWMGTHTGYMAADAGLDMTMPGPWSWVPVTNSTPSWFGRNLTIAVNNGSLALSRVDDMVRRVMLPYFALGQDKDFPQIDPTGGVYPEINDYEEESYWLEEWTAGGAIGNNTEPIDVRSPDHVSLIRTLGAAGTVLLKNTNGALPLKKPKNIGVFGNAAGDLTNGQYYRSYNYEYGCLPAGGGSGTSRFAQLISPLEAIKIRARADGSYVQYILNNTQLIYPGPATGQHVIISPNPDVCLVFLKTWAAEGEDRTSLASDWRGDEVVEAVAAVCPNTIVVTQSTGINLMPWADHENVTAILASHLSGEEIGNSLVDILYGDYNPSGHLPYTIAYNATDYDFAPVTTNVSNSTDTNAWQADFTERLLIDYRYFDYHNMSVRYEFGFGLSYTTFALSSLAISSLANDTITPFPAAEKTNTTSPGGNANLWTALYKVSVQVSNTGGIAGAAVPQLYLTLPATTGYAGEETPVKQLRGFEKIELAANGTQTVEFELMRRDISFWDVVAQDWQVPTGTFGVKVGFSSRDIQAEGSFVI